MQSSVRFLGNINARSRLPMLKHVHSDRYLVNVSKTSGKPLSRFARLILWAQRRSWPLPQGIRSTFRNLLRRVLPASDKQSPVEDWSAPLVSPRPVLIGAPIEMPTVSDALPAAPNPACERLSALHRCANEPASRLQCLIVTRVLDAGGCDEFVAFLARQLPVWGGI